MRVKVNCGMLACLLLSGSAAVAASPPQFDHVIVALETAEGYEKGALDSFQIYPQLGAATAEERVALHKALAAPELYSDLTLALACPGARMYEKCLGISVLRDVQVRSAVNSMPQSRILVVKPLAALVADKGAYSASMQVAQLTPGGKQARVLKRFTVDYRDFACSGECVKNAHTNAAKELTDMVTYMLDTSFGTGRDRSPPSWASLPSSRSTVRWTNKCVGSGGSIVSAKSARAWLTTTADIPLLSSYEWNGCS